MQKAACAACGFIYAKMQRSTADVHFDIVIVLRCAFDTTIIAACLAAPDISFPIFPSVAIIFTIARYFHSPRRRLRAAMPLPTR